MACGSPPLDAGDPVLERLDVVLEPVTFSRETDAEYDASRADQRAHDGSVHAPIIASCSRVTSLKLEAHGLHRRPLHHARPVLRPSPDPRGRLVLAVRRVGVRWPRAATATALCSCSSARSR